MREYIIRRLSAILLVLICTLSFADDSDWQNPPETVPKPASPFCCHNGPPFMEHYWLGLAIGGTQPAIDNYISVQNGTNFPSPRNEDRLTTTTNTTGLIDLSAGKLWTRPTTWLPLYSIGLRYRYMPKTDIGKYVVQFSSPEFTNYKYNLDISSQILTVQGKLGFYHYEAIQPYLSVGAGLGFHHTAKFTETALPGVTPRVSPGFLSNNDGNITYNLGFGFDFMLSSCWNAFIGYEYQALGTVYSGYGVEGWATQRLKISNYRANSVLFGVNYLL